MSDTGNAAAPAAGDGNAVVETPVLGGDTAAAATPPPDTNAPEPSWRERYAGEDKTALKRLERYATEADFFKGFRETETKARGKATLPVLPEDALPEEIDAHRKALGIPEKPEEYGLAFPQEYTTSEADTAALGAFAEHMHKAGVPPQFAKAAFEFYTSAMQKAQGSREDFAREATIENIADLRNEFKGREYTRNVTIAKEYLAKHFEGNEDALEIILATPIPGLKGVELGNCAPFVKGLVRAARETASEEALIAGDGGGGGRSVQEEYQALLKESVQNRREFARSGKQARLEQLAGLMAKRGQAA